MPFPSKHEPKLYPFSDLKMIDWTEHKAQPYIEMEAMPCKGKLSTLGEKEKLQLKGQLVAWSASS